MPEYLTLSDGRKMALLSDEEDRRVTAAALADPDAQPWTDEQLAGVRPRRFRFPRGGPGVSLVVLPSRDEDEEATGSK